MKYLIVGLGNIGPEYDMTRHNIGFDMADYFVMKHGGSFKLERLAFKAAVKWKGKSFIVIKPTTYMNLSGKALKYWMEKESIALENVLVLVDDLALPVEATRLRAGGAAAGHNGLKNIQLLLGTEQYARLRFGVGSDFKKGQQIPFVLGRWPAAELPIVKDKIALSADIIESFASQGISQAMTQYNKG